MDETMYIDLNSILGYIGGSILALQSLPQLYRAYHTKSTGDLSYAMFGVFFVGASFMMAYGICINEPPIYATLGFSVISNTILFYMKVVYDIKLRQQLLTLEV